MTITQCSFTNTQSHSRQSLPSTLKNKNHHSLTNLGIPVRSGSNSFSAVRRPVLGKISSQIVRSWLLLVFVIVRYRPILIQLSKSLMEFVKVTLLRVLLAVSVFCLVILRLVSWFLFGILVILYLLIGFGIVLGFNFSIMIELNAKEGMIIAAFFLLFISKRMKCDAMVSCLLD